MEVHKYRPWPRHFLSELDRYMGSYIILQHPVLSGGPTTSILDAANFFRLLGLALECC